MLEWDVRAGQRGRGNDGGGDCERTGVRNIQMFPRHTKITPMTFSFSWEDDGGEDEEARRTPVIDLLVVVRGRRIVVEDEDEDAERRRIGAAADARETRSAAKGRWLGGGRGER